MTELMTIAAATDEAVLRFMVGRRRPAADQLLRRLTHIGGARSSIALAGFSICLWPAAEPPRVAAFALVLSHALVQILKRSIARPRPVLPAGLHSLVATPDRFSFPSGHAAAALSVALGLALALPLPAAAAALALACLVGLSRCYLGVHFPGDVLMGWALAALSARLGMKIL